MSTTRSGWTTSSVEAVPEDDLEVDPTPGFVLVYSRLHADLPPTLPFAGETTTIGRERDNTLSIAEGAVSRYHARATRRPDGVWLEDLGSTNGTVVGGRRIERHRLEHEDLVRVGDSVFRYVERDVYAYAAYRIEGGTSDLIRPVKHGISAPLMVGGFQIDAVLAHIDKVSRAELSVVIAGESGTGKELVARELHRRSGRSGPLQAINCAALPANLLESELFGFRKGAFTGATEDKTGLVQTAHGGTLFLDEIGDMPLDAQVKLLRVIQEREVLPLGARKAQPVDVRVVSASHQDLEALVEQGRFRGDLLGRLREAFIELPPLRRRREDLYRLVRHFLARAGRDAVDVTFPYMLALAHYDFPYNVRELESAVKLSLALTDGDTLELRHLPNTIQSALDGHGSRSSPPLSVLRVRDETLSQQHTAPLRAGAPDEAELRGLLIEHRGNITAVARLLGKERMQVHRWLKRYAIDIEAYRR
jgi:DNA-binding NtrC family response regulator